MRVLFIPFLWVQFSTPTLHNCRASLRAVWKHILDARDILPTNRKKIQLPSFHLSGFVFCHVFNLVLKRTVSFSSFQKKAISLPANVLSGSYLEKVIFSINSQDRTTARTHMRCSGLENSQDTIFHSRHFIFYPS